MIQTNETSRIYFFHTIDIAIIIYLKSMHYNYYLFKVYALQLNVLFNIYYTSQISNIISWNTKPTEVESQEKN